ncbi:MAG: hypothetical protein ACUVQZ_08485 [Candidatus Caldatribacteriaceae bacterium]
MARKVHWIHFASATTLTHLEMSAHRGTKVHDEIGILLWRADHVM